MTPVTKPGSQDIGPYPRVIGRSPLPMNSEPPRHPALPRRSCYGLAAAR